MRTRHKTDTDTCARRNGFRVELSLNKVSRRIGTSVNTPIDNRSRVEFHERGTEDPRVKCRPEDYSLCQAVFPCRAIFQYSLVP